MFLVGIQCIVNAVFAKLGKLDHTSGRREGGREEGGRRRREGGRREGREEGGEGIVTMLRLKLDT